MSDIEDMVESERLQEIYTLKKQVYETKDEVDRAVAQNHIDQGTAIGLYQRKVRDYVMAVETLLNPADSDASEYWEDQRVGDFILPDGKHIDVIGLDEFLELPTTFEVEIQRKQQLSYRHKEEQVTKTTAARPPRQLNEHAFRMTNRALDAAGLDIDEVETTDESRFRKIDDIKKGAIVLDYLKKLDMDDLHEAKNRIDQIMREKKAKTNGHHE